MAISLGILTQHFQTNPYFTKENLPSRFRLQRSGQQAEGDPCQGEAHEPRPSESVRGSLWWENHGKYQGKIEIVDFP